MSTKVKERFVFLFIYSIVTMSPQREFLRIFPSAASFLFSPVDFHYVSSKRILMDFALSGLFSFSPVDLFCVSSRGNHGPSFNGFTFSSPQRIFTVYLRERTMNFAFNGCILWILPEDLHCVSSRENHGFCPQWPFHFHPQRIPCLLRENFHRFYPQWFSFYF